MSKFAKPTTTKKLTLILKEGNKEVELQPNEYWMLDGSDKIAIKHDILVKLADEHQVSVDKVSTEVAVVVSDQVFWFAHQAEGTLPTGISVQEVGEANPNNTEDISREYAFTMSHKRAVDRCIIRLLGIKDEVYSDSEFHDAFGNKVSGTNTPVTPKEDVKKETPKEEIKTEVKNEEAPKGETANETVKEESNKSDTPNTDKFADRETIDIKEVGKDEITKEIASKLTIFYGNYNGKTLGWLKTNNPTAFTWILTANMTSDNMRKLQTAAKLLNDAV